MEEERGKGQGVLNSFESDTIIRKLPSTFEIVNRMFHTWIGKMRELLRADTQKDTSESVV